MTTYLTPNFTLEQLTFDPLATRLQIVQQFKPTPAVIEALTETAQFVLEPLYQRFGTDLEIISAWKYKHVAFLYGEHPNNGHEWGRAVDFRVRGYSNWILMEWCIANMKFQLLEAEYMKTGDPYAGWVHLGYVTNKPLQQKVSYRLVDKAGKMECPESL